MQSNRHKEQKYKNYALLFILVSLIIIFYISTMVKLGAQ